MNRLESKKEYLQILSLCNPKMRKAIIQNGDKELISTICECILNCINGNIDINTDTKQKLCRHKEILRKLIQKRNSSFKQKKQLLIQKGGAILPIILSTVLSGLVSSLI